MYLILSILELPFIVIGWIDYFWNALCKALTGIFFGFAILSLITIPITLANNVILAFITQMKFSAKGTKISFDEAVEISLSRFPKL